MTDKAAPVFDALHVPPEAFEKGGGEVILVDMVPGFSTTGIVRRTRKSR